MKHIEFVRRCVCVCGGWRQCFLTLLILHHSANEEKRLSAACATTRSVRCQVPGSDLMAENSGDHVDVDPTWFSVLESLCGAHYLSINTLCSVGSLPWVGAWLLFVIMFRILFRSLGWVWVLRTLLIVSILLISAPYSDSLSGSGLLYASFLRVLCWVSSLIFSIFLSNQDYYVLFSPIVRVLFWVLLRDLGFGHST